MDILYSWEHSRDGHKLKEFLNFLFKKIILFELIQATSYKASHCSFRIFQGRGISPTLEQGLIQCTYLEWKHFCNAPISASIFSVSAEVQQEDTLIGVTQPVL